jgi:hypothetical protein
MNSRRINRKAPSSMKHTHRKSNSKQTHRIKLKSVVFLVLLFPL